MNREIKNNQVTLNGEIVSNFEFSHEVYGKGFYTAMLSVKRTSGKKDIIPIIVSERLIDISKDWTGEIFYVIGEFRSYNKHENGKSKLILSVFTKYIEILVENKLVNTISLDGYICKPPIYRKTPLEREIANILLAVNRLYRKADYIPCIAWGRNARFARNLEIGTKLKIEGRIQSREYRKRISETESEVRTAYEVSISRMEIVEDGQNED